VPQVSGRPLGGLVGTDTRASIVRASRRRASVPPVVASASIVRCSGRGPRPNGIVRRVCTRRAKCGDRRGWSVRALGCIARRSLGFGGGSSPMLPRTSANDAAGQSASLHRVCRRSAWPNWSMPSCSECAVERELIPSRVHGCDGALSRLRIRAQPRSRHHEPREAWRRLVDSHSRVQR
jgi:hypothetical protein